jgi:hypothetical protein
MVVRGEGEFPLLRLAQLVLHGQGALTEIPGLAYLDGGRVQINPASPGPYQDIDRIPFPDYSLLENKDFYLPTVVTARGCKYRCRFCSEGNVSRPYRPRNLANVEAELRALSDHYEGRLPYLQFVDDCFTASAQRVHAMCDLLERLFPDLSRFGFYCEGRVNVLADHPDLIRRLKEAGLLRLQIGIETGNQDLLRSLAKEIHAEQIEKVVSDCHLVGIAAVNGFFMCGLPGQTEAHVQQDIEFAKHLLDLTSGTIELKMVPLTPLPGTEFGINATQWGLSVFDGDFVTGWLLDGCFCETSRLSREAIQHLCCVFNSEVQRYALQKAPCLSPARTKKLLVLAADRQMYTRLTMELIPYLHIRQLLDLRFREDYRFLFELPSDDVLAAAPVRMLANTTKPIGCTYLVNDDSPMFFEMTQEEVQDYAFFTGKLSFRAIAQRRAQQEAVPVQVALDRCLNTYLKCEDKLAVILAV